MSFKKTLTFSLFFFCVCIFFASSKCLAKPLTAEDVLSSSSQHFPKIISALEEVKAAEGRVQNAIGAFDLRLDQDLSSRPSGFYDGRFIDSRLVKRMPALNSRVYGGYRVSDGNFPIYEDKFFTNDGGEYNIGFALSLLRNSTIDKDRFALRDTKLDVAQKNLELLLTKVFVQHKALHKYYSWLASGQKLKVYRELLNIANNRQDALKKKVERGAVAEIFLTENMQYILQREILLNEAKRDFKNKSNDLSLYYRDKNSVPIIPTEEDLKKFPRIKQNKSEILKKDIDEIKSKRPDLNILEVNIDKTENKLKFSENLILPKIDLGVEAAQDNGNGSVTREGFESIFKLEVSIPIQRNFAKGKIAEAKAERRKFEQDRKLISDKIKVEIENLLNDIDTSFRYLKLTDREVDVAIKMQKAENERFQQGISDFLLLNIREERMASSKLNNIESKFQYFTSLANYYVATADLDNLMLD